MFLPLSVAPHWESSADTRGHVQQPSRGLQPDSGNALALQVMHCSLKKQLNSQITLRHRRLTLQNPPKYQLRARSYDLHRPTSDQWLGALSTELSVVRKTTCDAEADETPRPLGASTWLHALTYRHHSFYLCVNELCVRSIRGKPQTIARARYHTVRSDTNENCRGRTLTDFRIDTVSHLFQYRHDLWWRAVLLDIVLFF